MKILAVTAPAQEGCRARVQRSPLRASPHVFIF